MSSRSACEWNGMATKKRIFCDTNILLDILDPERAFHADAVALLWYCADNSGQMEAIASITSFKDAYYILSRLYKDADQARESIAGIMGSFIQPVDMLAAYGAEAISPGEPDFEDGLIRACAERERASVLVTRDVRAFSGSPIPAMTAAEFLAQEGFDYEVIDW